MTSYPNSPVRLLSLRDAHEAPLADFDWHSDLNLLEVLWHGHLTAAGLVRGVQAGLELPLFTGHLLPHRVLSNHHYTSGGWEEALPWLQYDWLPRAEARGLRLLAYVVSPDPASRLTQADQREFLDALHQAIRVQPFRHQPPAWHWLTHR